MAACTAAREAFIQYRATAATYAGGAARRWTSVGRLPAPTSSLPHRLPQPILRACARVRQFQFYPHVPVTSLDPTQADFFLSPMADREPIQPLRSFSSCFCSGPFTPPLSPPPSTSLSLEMMERAFLSFHGMVHRCRGEAGEVGRGQSPLGVCARVCVRESCYPARGGRRME